MNICISNDYISLKLTHVIDYFISIIWNTKYNDLGDFEIVIPIIDNSIIQNININVGDLLWLSNDYTDVRIINDLQLQFSVENGYYITIKGYSFEYILNNRVVWEQTNINDSVSSAIYDLVVSNCIASTMEYRNLGNFRVNNSYSNTNVIQAQYYGDNLYTIIKDLGNQYNFACKINRIDDNFVFALYSGENEPITFSQQLGNLLEYSVELDNSNYKNSALILGEGQGINRTSVEVNGESNYKRFELYVNGSELSQNKDSETSVITLNEYKKILKQNGESYLENYKTDFKFECKIYPDLYKFKQDYFVGDKVNVITDFVYQGSNIVNGLITEVVESWSDKGYECYPTIKF